MTTPPAAATKIPHSTSAYRPDIDGLRAVAVLLVVAFHLHAGWMPGGFVGVDVFFVISGFVVTSSLASRDVGGRFGVADFYGRRIKRLVPALLVSVLATTALYACLVPPVPNEFNTAVYRTGMASVVGLSNLYLWRSGTSYFDGDVLPNPFTHTWSLGVEEQFYLLFPLLWRFAASVGPLVRVAPRRALITAVAALGLLSCLASAYWSQRAPTTAYFAMPSRFWELALGAVIAFRTTSISQVMTRRPRLARAGQGLGLALVCAAGALTPARSFPMPGAVPAAVGTALIIACGAASPGWVGALLSRAPSVYLGRASYSLYLWHWPAIAIASRLYGEGSATTTWVAVAVTMVGTLASYHLVEGPIRRGVRWRSVAIVTAGLATGLCVVGGVDYARRHRTSLYLGSGQRWSTDWAVADGALVEGRIPQQACHLTGGATMPDGVDARCLFEGSGPAPRRVWAFGDSHTAANWPMLLSGVSAGEYSLYALSQDGHVSPGSRGTNSHDRYWAYVMSTAEHRVRTGDVVMVATFLRLRPIDARARGEFEALRRLITSRGATLLLQAPLPVLPRRAFECLPTRFSRTTPSCDKDRALDRREGVDAMGFAREFGRKPGVALWDPYDLLCPGVQCHAFRDGRPLFRDDDHLSLFGSRSLGPAFRARLHELWSSTPNHVNPGLE